MVICMQYGSEYEVNAPAACVEYILSVFIVLNFNFFHFCLERLICKMACYVSSWTLISTTTAATVKD